MDAIPRFVGELPRGGGCSRLTRCVRTDGIMSARMVTRFRPGARASAAGGALAGGRSPDTLRVSPCR